jgi:ABC-type branched-subunit amino acid transport system substrate-binding protein
VLVATLLVSTVGTASGRTTSASKTACKKTSGEPVLISMVAFLSGASATPGLFVPAATAAMKSVNCEGGVKGRPIKLIVCDGSLFTDPNKGQNCARDAIQQGVVASVGSSPDNNVSKAFDDAGVPIIGVALSPVAFTAKTSFPLNAGVPGALAGLAAGLYDRGARKIRVLVVETPSAAAIASFANKGLEPRGAKALETVQLPSDPAADDSAIIQAAIADGTDALILTLTEPQIKKVAPEIRAAGFKGMLAATATSVAPDVPAVKNFLFGASLYPASAKDQPGIAQFNKDMDKYAPNGLRLESSITVWSAIRVVADALKHAPTIDKTALLNVLSTYKVDLGTGPTVDFSSGGNAFGIPRLFTQQVVMQKVKNKQYVLAGDFFDPTVPPTKASGSTSTTSKK